MRSILALFLFAGVAACSSDSFTPPPPVVDAAADAPLVDASDGGGPGFCASQAPGYIICDDFDPVGDGATGLNGAWLVTTDNGGTVSRTSTRFLSPGFGFEATTRPGKSSATVYRNPNAGLAARLTLTLAIYLSAGCVETGSGAQLPAIVSADTTLAKSYFLSLSMSDDKVALLEGTQGPADAGFVGAGKVGKAVWPTDKWVHVFLEAELGAVQVVHVRIDSGEVDDFPLTAQLGTVTLPGVSIGASTEPGRATACTVDYDDVMLRISGK